MGQRFLIDTNTIIYYMNNEIPQKELNKVKQILKDSFIVSIISNIETLGWYNIAEDEKVKLTDFLSYSSVIYIDKRIQDKAIEIRQTKKIKLGDSIIAATALIHNLTIVTRNETDFWGLGLKIYNPFEDK